MVTHSIDDRLVQGRVAGLSLRQTAAVCGVSVSTVQRRLRDASLQEQISEGRSRQQHAEARDWEELRSLSRRTLHSVMASPDNQGVAVRAALGALGAAERFDFMHEFARRQDVINDAILQRLAAETDDGDDRARFGR